LPSAVFEGLGEGVELKFNPYHDPRDGRFTFAPGGPHDPSSNVTMPGAIDRIGRNTMRSAFAARPQPGGGGRGGNIRAFQDPMTLQQVFPGLRNAPGGAIIAVGDTLLNFTGPANELTTMLAQKQAVALINQIRAIDPGYRADSAGTFPQSFEGQMTYLNGLRLDRASALYRLRGDARLLQIETIRYLQRSVDRAYAAGLQLQKEGRLTPRLSDQEALGNFIDRRAREDLRKMYNQYSIRTGVHQEVKVIGREYETRGTDRTYRVPDARVANLAIDVTLTRKTLSTAQVRGFFNADFKPDATVIVRPSQLGSGSTYIITRSRN
jgi:hypothetical protein